MTYKELTMFINGESQMNIIVEFENGDCKSFSKDETNKCYINFIEHIDEYEHTDDIVADSSIPDPNLTTDERLTQIELIILQDNVVIE